MSSPIRARRPGATRSTTRRPAASRPRPSAVRAASRRAHLLEQEVTLAYLRELVASDSPPRHPNG